MTFKCPSQPKPFCDSVVPSVPGRLTDRASGMWFRFTVIEHHVCDSCQYEQKGYMSTDKATACFLSERRDSMDQLTSVWIKSLPLLLSNRVTLSIPSNGKSP